MLDTYKATLENADTNRAITRQSPALPVMAIGASHFFGDLVRQSLVRIGVDPTEHYVFDACGHALALERPHELADRLTRFFLGVS